MITKDVKNMWVDKQGNTCFGIKPETIETPEPQKIKETKQPIKKKETEEEGLENGGSKSSKRSRR